MSSVRSPVLPTPSIFLLPIPLSFSLSVFFSLCLAVLLRVSSSPCPPLSLSLHCVPFAKLRSIFHLEFRRSLAINPRIHYGLRGPYCSLLRDIRTLPACPPVCLPACLLACLPACPPARLARLPASVIGFASLRGTTSTIQTRRLSGMRRHSRSLVRRGFSRVPP